MTRSKILLADDSLPSLYATKAMLEKLGYEVDTADNGDKALSLAMRETFAYLLLDEFMPGQRGSEVARALRETDGPNQQTRIFALTGATESQEQAEILAAGIDAIISKPVNAARLAAELTPADSRENILDQSTLDTLQDDLGEATAKRLLGLFAKELAELTQRLASDPGNADDVSAVSHILKNSAALYGATELANTAREINEQTQLTRDNAAQAAALLCKLSEQTLSSVQRHLTSGE